MRPNPAIFLCIGVATVLSGCARLPAPSAPPSAIVDKVEKAGAGDLSVASTDAIRGWLSQHKELAYEVDGMCKPMRQSAIASWGDSTEGRLCAVARELAFARTAPAKSDGRTFRPGLH